jgi:hypothetical protein
MHFNLQDRIVYIAEERKTQTTGFWGERPGSDRWLWKQDWGEGCIVFRYSPL